MATEALTRTTATRTGLELALQAVTSADGFTFPNDGHTFLYVVNDAGALAMVFTIQKTLDGQSATRTSTVTASENWILGPWPTELYNDSDGLVTCTPDADLAAGVACFSW